MTRYDRQEYLANKTRYRHKALDRRYGVGRFEELWLAQGGRCANDACRAELRSQGQGGAHVDHNHDCCPGEKTCGNCVRGLLCANCNVAIRQGMTPSVLRGLADYLDSRPLRPKAQLDLLSEFGS